MKYYHKTRQKSICGVNVDKMWITYVEMWITQYFCGKIAKMFGIFFQND